MDEFQQSLLESIFLYQALTSLETQAHLLRPQVKNNIGSGKYELLKRIDHDRKILRTMYDENMKKVLAVYQEALDVEFELLK